MAYLCAVFTGLLIALSNLFVRQSVIHNYQRQGDPFIILRLFGAAVLAAGLAVISDTGIKLDFPMILLGAFAGFLLGSLMWTIGRSVKEGPSSLTFAVINVACVIPPLLMALLFGKDFGHEYSWINGIGAICVMIGIFWMSSIELKDPGGKKWFLFVALAFLVHVTLLSFFQWRALLFQEHTPNSLLLPFRLDRTHGECFTFSMFITAMLMQVFFQSKLQKDTMNSESISISQTRYRWLSIRYGFLGGVLNGLGSYILVCATEFAKLPSEKAWIFPIYCVSLISFCNLWSRLFYSERVHWAGNALCFIGILIGVR